MIKIISNIDIVYKDSRPQGVGVFNRTWQPLHLRQGDMDGACAVYSLMMNLLVLKILTRNQICGLSNPFKGNTSKGRLFKEFLYDEGLCRVGFFFSSPDGEPNITDKLRHSFTKEVKSTASKYDSCNDKQTLAVDTIKKSIDEDNSIMIAETFCDGAHAMLAIGYEVQNETLTKIFCLDPGNMISDYSYWNAVIRLNERTNSKYRHICISKDNCTDVYISETLKITKK